MQINSIINMNMKINKDYLHIVINVTGVTHQDGNTSDGNTSDICHKKSILQDGCHRESNHMLTLMKYSLNCI